MKRWIAAFGLAVALLAWGGLHGACLINVSTGYDDSLGAVFDPAGGDTDDTFLVSGPLGQDLEPIVVNHTAFPVPPWLPPTEESLWISVSFDTNAPPGQYTYEITFEVPPEVDPSTLTLQGRWATDDRSVDLLINGQSTGLRSAGFTMWADFPENTGLGLFKEGTNTIQFIVENGGDADNPTGLRVEGCVATRPDVPEERPYNVSTGFDEAAKHVLADGEADTNFTIEGPEGSGISGNPITLPGGDPWWPDTINSRWIGPDTQGAIGPPGAYRYTVTVTLPSQGFDIQRAILKGGFTADTFVTDVIINGTSTGLVSEDPSRLTIFPVDAGQGLFKAGENTVVFVVENSEEGVTGLRVDAQIVEGPPVPEAEISLLSLDTGFDDATGVTIANGMPDDNWVLLGPPGSDIGPVMATVVADDQWPVAPAGPWVASTERSKWIGTDMPTSSGPAGVFTFRIQVEVPEGVDPGELAIIGFMSSDNAGRDVIINGVSTGFGPTGNFGALEPIPEGLGKGLFQTGVNVVEVVVENADAGPVGLRVEAVVGSGLRAENLIVTGIEDRTGLPLPAGGEDLSFTVLAPAAASPRPAVVMAPAGVSARGWLANSERSLWIGLDQGDSVGPAGVYQYETTFTLPPYLNPVRVEIRGGWSAAQKGTDVILNGTSLGLTADNPGALSAFPDGTGRGLILPGLNTLQFLVENTQEGSTGLRVEAELAVRVEPNPFDISSGFDQEAGQALAQLDLDEDYLVTSPNLEEEQAQVLEPNPAWLQNTEASMWIGPATAAAGDPGDYVYQVVVDLPPEADPASAYLEGAWAADDAGLDIRINGNSTGATTTAGFAGFTPFPPELGKGLFQAGTNTIEFVVNNGGTGPNPTGLRVEAVVVAKTGGGGEVTFIRGDTNADGGINIADAIFLLGYLFGGQGEPSCLDSGDANDDGGLNVADAISILSHLFAGTGDLPPPFTSCGTDPTDDALNCASFKPCAE